MRRLPHSPLVPPQPGQCVSRTNNNLPSNDTADLSSSASLFFSASFNLTRFSLDTNDNIYCGTYSPPSNPSASYGEQVGILAPPPRQNKTMRMRPARMHCSCFGHSPVVALSKHPVPK